MDKIKSKIKSLLALAMSDNKHEADLALQRALELMNKNNLTRDKGNYSFNSSNRNEPL
jgi:hypothetical protein